MADDTANTDEVDPATFNWSALNSEDEAVLDRAVANLKRMPKGTRFPKGVEIFIGCGDPGPIRFAPKFSIKNGPTSALNPFVIRSSISPAYHWPVIENLPAAKALDYTEAFIRTAEAQITAHRSPYDTDALIRKQAICIGVTRAVTTAYYEITEKDLTPAETAEPILTYKAHVEGTLIMADQLMFKESSEVDNHARMKKTLSLGNEEKAAIGCLLMSQIAALPVSGYSLFMTGHHYLRDGKNQSKRAYDAVERQHWKRAAADKWFKDNTDMIRDMCWHKSCHPVSDSIKLNLARSKEVRSRLIEAGCGSGSVRLPAEEVEHRVANTYLTLLNSVKTFFLRFGGVFEYNKLEEALAAVDAFPVGEGTPVAGWIRPESVPGTVVNRETAIANLRHMLKRNADTIAMVYGFFVALTDEMEIIGSQVTTNTLKEAYSLVNLKRTNIGAYYLGFEYYSDYKAMRRAVRAKGEFDPPDARMM